MNQTRPNSIVTPEQLDALQAAGFVVVHKRPTPEMIKRAVPKWERDPLEVWQAILDESLRQQIDQ